MRRFHVKGIYFCEYVAGLIEYKQGDIFTDLLALSKCQRNLTHL